MIRSDSSARAVSMMIGTAAVFSWVRTARQISRPSICGSIRARTKKWGGFLGEGAERFAARGHDRGRKAGAIEIVSNQFGDVAIVFDDQHARRHVFHSS